MARMPLQPLQSSILSCFKRHIHKKYHNLFRPTRVRFNFFLRLRNYANAMAAAVFDTAVADQDAPLHTMFTYVPGVATLKTKAIEVLLAIFAGTAFKVNIPCISVPVADTIVALPPAAPFAVLTMKVYSTPAAVAVAGSVILYAFARSAGKSTRNIMPD